MGASYVIKKENRKLVSTEIDEVIEEIKQNNEITSLVLRNAGLGPNFAVQLSDFLEQNNTLTELDLSGNPIGSHGATCFASSLSKNKTLRCLKLAACSIKNDAIIFWKDFFHLKQNKSLQTLSFARNEIDDEGVLLLADAIPEIQTKGFSLDLRENNISDVGIQAMTESVSQCLSMVSLRIEGNLEEESTPRIKKMEHHLRQHKKILQREYLFSTILRLEESCLHLNYCYIDHIPISIFDAELLARALQRNVSTIELRLQNNSLPMEGTKRILKSLHSNRTLHSLSFIDNNIGNGGMESVRILIRESTTLKKIQITNMIHTTPENGLQIFSLRTASRLYRSLAYHSSLTSLTLANCGLDDDRIGALVPAIAWRGIMEYLDIRNNPFSDHSVYVFCEMLQRCARLFHLDVSGAKMTLSGVVPLVEKVSCSDHIETLILGRFAIYEDIMLKMIDSLRTSTSLIRVELASKQRPSVWEDAMRNLKNTLKANKIMHEKAKAARDHDLQLANNKSKILSIFRQEAQLAVKSCLVRNSFQARIELQSMRLEDNNILA